MNGNCIACQEKPSAPRVVVVGLASCFGCQLQITNAEAHLLDVLGQIDLRYWQLASSDPMPEDFDVAIIEGAVTTEESEATVRSLREKAGAIIAVGACATTAGIPGMAAEGFLERPGQVYDRVPSAPRRRRKQPPGRRRISDAREFPEREKPTSFPQERG